MATRTPSLDRCQGPTSDRLWTCRVSVRPRQTRASSVPRAVCASKTIQQPFFRVMLTHVKCINIPIGMTHLEGTVISERWLGGGGEAFFNRSRHEDQLVFGGLALLKKAVTATVALFDSTIVIVMLSVALASLTQIWSRSPSWGDMSGCPPGPISLFFSISAESGTQASSICLGFSLLSLMLLQTSAHSPWADGEATHVAGLWGQIQGCCPPRPFRLLSTVGELCCHCGCYPLLLCSVEVLTLVSAVKRMKQDQL